MTDTSPEEQPPDPQPGEPLGTPVGRRVIVGMGAVGVAGIVFGSKISDGVNRFVQNIGGKDKTGLTQFLPVGGGFRIYTVTNGYPSMERDSYKLTVGGMVDSPLELSYDELMQRPLTEMTRDFQCVTGWRVENVHWRGVLLRDLLNEAGVQDEAQAIRFTSFDGVYTESLTLSQAMRNDVLVAYEMLGAPVTREHGGPVRMYVAPMYGYKSIKWLSGIEVVSTVIPGYWEERGYDVDGWVGASNGRNDEQIEGSEIDAG